MSTLVCSLREKSWRVPLGARALTIPLVPTMAAALLVSLFCMLGFWQLGRAAEKEARIRQVRSAGAQAPVPLAALARAEGRILRGEPGAVAALLGKVTEGAGRYDGTRTFLLDNRTRRGRAGYHVLTPFLLGEPQGPEASAGKPDAGGDAPGRRAVLVNRGWIPAPAERSELPPVAPPPAGMVRLRGTLWPPREDQMVLGETGYGPQGTGAGAWPRIVQRIELRGAEALLGYRLLPVVVRLDPGAAGGFVREWQPSLGIPPERHRGYAVQWFALAFAVAVVWLVVNLRPRAPSGHGLAGPPSGPRPGRAARRDGHHERMCS